MPIYEYECSKCGHKLEAFQKMQDVPLTECPTCHKNALQKLVSAAGFQLKGTGWYATDFRNKSNPEPKTDTKESGNTDAKTATKTDTKPESKDKKSTTGSVD